MLLATSYRVFGLPDRGSQSNRVLPKVKIDWMLMQIQKFAESACVIEDALGHYTNQWRCR